MKYDESDNLVIRASRTVTDKISYLFGKLCLFYWQVFSSPEHRVLRMSYCDHTVRPSVGRPFKFPCLHSSIYKYINTVKPLLTTTPKIRPTRY